MFRIRRLFVGIHSHIRPVLALLDKLGVVVDLRLIAGKLLVAVGRNAGIGCNPPSG